MKFTPYTSSAGFQVDHPEGYQLYTGSKQACAPRRLPHEILRFCYDPSQQDAGVYVTGRELHEYPQDVTAVTIEAMRRPFEVGAGLGALVEYWLHHFRDAMEDKVTVIDPANFPLMLEMLDFALTYEEQVQAPEVWEKARTFRRRCALLLDSTKVRLIQKPLSQAVVDHPELEQTATLVVDNCGTALYGQFDGEKASPDLEYRKSMRALLERLKAPHGKVFHSYARDGTYIFL